MRTYIVIVYLLIALATFNVLGKLFYFKDMVRKRSRDEITYMNLLICKALFTFVPPARFRIFPLKDQKILPMETMPKNEPISLKIFYNFFVPDIMRD